MDADGPLYILAGNGPYTNRGCEAIVRGTTRILREFIQNPRFLCFSHFQSEGQFHKQAVEEADSSITHLSAASLSKGEALRNFWKPSTWRYAYGALLNENSLKYTIYRGMIPHIRDAASILSVGGDNYSLDYGIPKSFTGLDDVVLEHDKPLFIWGASVGPFSAMPDYERYMSKHLRDVTGIFARESATIDYLESIGVAENVYPVADPAFLMDPVAPEGAEDLLLLDDGAIGLNLSPLMAEYVCGGDMAAWTNRAASIVESVAEGTEMRIYLIPHVTNPSSDDHSFMERALSLVEKGADRITLIPPEYDAAETKWIISRMSLFAGARTHSTIASLSTGVPTLSFAYSIKARGINHDIFGHSDYCVDPSKLNSETVSSQIMSMLESEGEIGRDLRARIPTIQAAALSAGRLVRDIVDKQP